MPIAMTVCRAAGWLVLLTAVALRAQDLDLCFPIEALPASGTISPAPGFLVTPQFLKFGRVPVGSGRNATACITTPRPQTLSAATDPASPFHLFDRAEVRLVKEWERVIPGLLRFPVRFQPTAAGLFEGTLTVYGDGLRYQQIRLEGEGLEPLLLPAIALPPATLGDSYDYPLTSTGGAQPFRWEIAAGRLPNGLQLDGHRLTGKPAEAGRFAFTVQLTDGEGSQVRAALELVVSRRVPIIRQLLSGADRQSPVGASSWLTILGESFATEAYSWAQTRPDVLPVELGGVTVSVGGVPAYVQDVRETTINVILPENVPAGPAEVIVTNGGASSQPVRFDIQSFAPAPFVSENRYVTARGSDGTEIGPGTPFGNPPTRPTRPARPAELVTLLATGLGQTDPPWPLSRVPAEPLPLTAKVQVFLGEVEAEVLSASLTPLFPFTHQVQVRIPEQLAAGEWPVRLMVEGVASTTNERCCFLNVQP